MTNGRNVEGLAGAAAYLWCAQEELIAAGYDQWSTEIRMLVDIIDAEAALILETNVDLPLG